MKRLFFILFVIIIFGAGCSANNKGEAGGQWNYQEGYVVAKDEANRQLLVVREKVDNLKNKKIEQILKESDPDAVWLKVTRKQYGSVEEGDHVKVSIQGGIDQSYPAQAAADSVEKK
ncbi:DUF3221 domain-containing protein [Paenibacillus luteus]|uniref:DUF3221 domain-containing protein n=1 Tax=Paenibacillus luteus TaxID=2545753 RepID=UPI0013762815|nr:DUF3221 domain-containing protein [Paenibacillus luteus]